MNSDGENVVLSLPVEYLDALREVMRTGLQRAAINPLIKQELAAWWNAEREFIDAELDQKNNG